MSSHLKLFFCNRMFLSVIHFIPQQFSFIISSKNDTSYVLSVYRLWNICETMCHLCNNCYKQSFLFQPFFMCSPGDFPMVENIKLQHYHWLLHWRLLPPMLNEHILTENITISTTTHMFALFFVFHVQHLPYK